ncbi:MAG: amino acid transporter [Acidimicrobiia bacterium]|nr:amino acid transporter [Acidimicrobiia bacterium]
MDLDNWAPLSLGDTRTVMDGLDLDWWIAGGHALELHTGRSWRSHADIDVGLVREQVSNLRTLTPGWDLFAAAAGVLTPWHGETLPDGTNNIWGRRNEGPFLVDFTVGAGSEAEWIYRRNPRLRLPWQRAVLTTDDGLRYLAPALQLLFKSKDVRPKDDLDARTVLPLLDPWSLAVLDLWLPPSHPWSRLVREYRPGMESAAVLSVLDLLDEAWVDGGWGVDALVGRQTRRHLDLDLALPTRNW